METFIILGLWIIAIVVLAYVGFWVIAKIGFPAPFDMVARVVLGVACLLLLIGLFLPSLGVHIGK